MIASRCLLNGFLVIALTMSVLVHNVTGTSASRSDDEGGDGGGGGGAVVDGEGTTLLPSLMNRVTGVIDSFKLQASETIDGAESEAGSAASVLSHLQPGTTKQMSEVGGNGVRASEKKLPSGDNTPGRLQETKGRTEATTKKVVDETVHKMQTTVSDIRRTINGDDLDDVSDDRRISSSFDGLFQPWAWKSRRCLSWGPKIKPEQKIGKGIEKRKRIDIEIKKKEKEDQMRVLELKINNEKIIQLKNNLWLFKKNKEIQEKEKLFIIWAYQKFKDMDIVEDQRKVPPRSEVTTEQREEVVVSPRTEVTVEKRGEVVISPMHPVTKNSYNNTSNSLTNSDLVILIFIIITTIILR